MGRSPGAFRLVVAAVVLAVLSPAAARAQALLKVNDDVFFRFGVMLQGQADWTEDASADAYQQNLFLRRARILVGGQAARNVTFLFMTDSPDLGKSTATGKNVSSGFKLQDAWLQWKIADQFALNAGLMLVPLARQVIVSPSAYLTMDVSPASTAHNAPTQLNTLRDHGLSASGFLLRGRLEYRAGVYQGVRYSGSHNSFRRSAMLQYNFFEAEKGYVYPETYLAKKKVMGVHAGYDAQGDYSAWSGAFFGMLPLREKTSEFAWLAQVAHYDGDDFEPPVTTPPTPALKTQDTYLVEAGYLFGGLHLQPFVKWESVQYDAEANQPGDVDRVGVGFNYYVAAQNLKISAQYQKADFSGPELKDTDQYTLQIQLLYY
jgi:hypothetical protein